MKQILIFFLFAAFASCQDSSKNDKLNDSTEIKSFADTTKLDTGEIKETTTTADLLPKIQVDKSSFKQEYRKLRKKGDEFEKSKFLFDASSPQYVNRNGVFLYINEAGPVLRFTIQYSAEDWLFIKNMVFNVDGTNYEYDPSDEFKRDNGEGGIWEWSDEIIGSDQFPMLQAIALGRKVKVKYVGSQYYKIVEISAKQQQAIKHILITYKGLLLGYNK
jgi:hypothetical protein